MFCIVYSENLLSPSQNLINALIKAVILTSIELEMFFVMAQRKSQLHVFAYLRAIKNLSSINLRNYTI